MTARTLPPCVLGLDGETLSAWRDGLLFADESRRIASHTPGCASCQRNLGDFETIASLLNGQRAPTLRAEVWDGVKRRIMESGQRGFFMGRGRIWGGAVAAVVVVTLVGLFAALLARGPLGGPQGGGTPGPAATACKTPTPFADPTATVTAPPAQTPGGTPGPTAPPDPCAPTPVSGATPTATTIQSSAYKQLGWTAPPGVAQGLIPRVAFAASKPSVGYACTCGSRGALQISKTSDGGATWKFLSSPISGAFCFVTVNPTNSDDILVNDGNSFTNVIVRSRDGGVTWQKQNAGTLSFHTWGWARSTLLVGTPDTVETHRPTQCGTCQRTLPADAPSWVERRQVSELPPLRLQVSEHRILHVRCPACGATSAAEAPAGVRAPQQYGPRLRALCAYLVQQQFVPYARVREVVADVFGAALSVGTLVNLVRQGAARLVEVEQEIKAALRDAPVLHHDETGLGVAGAEGARLEWTHATCTPTLTHYGRHAARGAAALEAIGILPGCRGTSVHDGWTSYRHFQTVRHALCNAHHLRELSFVHEELQQAWAGQLKALLRQMRTAVEQARASGATQLPGTVRDDFIMRYEALVGEGLAQNPQPPPPSGPGRKPRRGRRKQSPVRNLLDRLWTYEHEALRFLEDFAVPFGNSQAERDLRMVMVQQKVSGTFCSDVGADAFCRIRSVCSMWRKQGCSVLDALTHAFASHSLSLRIPS
jgi:transposase